MELVKFNLGEESIEGHVSDIDSLYISALLLPDFAKIRDKEAGLSASYDKFSKRHTQILASAASPEEKAKEMYKEWGERFLIRITTDLNIRSSLAQRLTEIFPGISSDLVSYDRWTDPQGNVHDRSTIRLDAEQAMTIVTAIASAGSEKKKAKSKAKPQGFAAGSTPPVEVEADAVEVDEADEIAALRARLAALEGSEA